MIILEKKIENTRTQFFDLLLFLILPLPCVFFFADIIMITLELWAYNEHWDVITVNNTKSVIFEKINKGLLIPFSSFFVFVFHLILLLLLLLPHLHRSSSSSSFVFVCRFFVVCFLTRLWWCLSLFSWRACCFIFVWPPSPLRPVIFP